MRAHSQNLLTDPTPRKWTQGTRWRTSPDLPQQQPLSPPLPPWQQQQGPTLSPPLKPGWKPRKQPRRSCPSTDKLCSSTCRDNGETHPSLLEGQNSFKRQEVELSRNQIVGFPALLFSQFLSYFQSSTGRGRLHSADLIVAPIRWHCQHLTRHPVAVTGEFYVLAICSFTFGILLLTGD